jgi:hypothetical protein
MDKLAQFVTNANFCRKAADQTTSIEQRVRWLELAARWLKMVDHIQSRSGTAEECFEAAVHVSGTGQDCPPSRN